MTGDNMMTPQDRTAQAEGATSYLRYEIALKEKELAGLRVELNTWEQRLVGKQIGPIVSHRKRAPKRQRKVPRRLAPTQRTIIRLLEEAGHGQTVSELTYPAYERGLITSRGGVEGVRQAIASALGRMKVRGLVSVDRATHRYSLPTWSTNGHDAQGKLPTLAANQS